MPKFNYIAMDGRGKEQKGTIEAESEQAGAAKLKQKGLFPTSITEAKGRAAKGPGSGAPKFSLGRLSAMGFAQPALSSKQLTIFPRQLAVLLDAGLPLVRALRTLERQSRKNFAMLKVMQELANAVEGGSTFSEGLAGQSRSFNKLYVNMVRAGEASGAMETVLNRLAEFMEKAERIAGKVKSAMVYPVIVLTVAMTITSGLMIFIVPKFSKIFDEMLPGEPLPGLTMFVICISNFMKDQAIVMFGGLFALFVAFKMFKKTKAGAFAIDLFLIKVPPINSLVVKSSVARFCRTLGTLMQSGVAVLQALQIVRDTAGNEMVVRAIQSVHDAVKEGEGMSRPLEQAGIFPGMVVSMIEVGEETGALPEMLNRIADVYEEEIDRAVEAMTSLREPIVMVSLAVVVGGIVIALFLPLIKLIDKLGSG